MKNISCVTAAIVRGNPGPAAIGMVVTDAAGEVLWQEGMVIGNSTAVLAAYQAVAACLERLTLDGPMAMPVLVQLTNETVVAQLNGQTPVTDPGLVPMFMAIHNLRVLHFPQLVVALVSPMHTVQAEIVALSALDGVSTLG